MSGVEKFLKLRNFLYGVWCFTVRLTACQEQLRKHMSGNPALLPICQSGGVQIQCKLDQQRAGVASRQCEAESARCYKLYAGYDCCCAFGQKGWSRWPGVRARPRKAVQVCVRDNVYDPRIRPISPHYPKQPYASSTEVQHRHFHQVQIERCCRSWQINPRFFWLHKWFI